jgi:glycosyltransferase involved in cell wall biosynthesis
MDTSDGPHLPGRQPCGGPNDSSGHKLLVMQAHNRYKSNVPSGENEAVSMLHDAYISAGAEVTGFYPSSDALATLPNSAKLTVGIRVLGHKNDDFRRILRESNPDVLVVHNLYPYISPRDLGFAQHTGVPVVHVVHNYRHSCLKGTHFRERQVCNSCATMKFAGPGVWRACYRGSRLQSAVIAFSNRIYHWPWRNLDAYVAVSTPIADYLTAQGFPSERVHVIPNPVRMPAPSVAAGRGVLYAGRLEHEKGVGLLLDAWELVPFSFRQHHRLNMAGEGELSGLVRERSRSDPSIVHHGFLSTSALASVAAECSTTVIPSIWSEPFGLQAVEALMRGHAVVATNRGALADIVADGAGWIVQPEPQAMSVALMESLAADNRARAERGRAIALGKYGLRAVGERYLEVFRSVAGRN